ncbi:hypothetical protein RCC89_13145 [Cytophagaceae bacterium ABcell3]|nr:hypothetical protein RCC89_13145 [Cytophagaceae bacterium ABcell3]
MAYIQFYDDPNYALRYEGLSCFAFDCVKYGGAGRIAYSDFYGENMVPEPTTEGINAIKLILSELISKAESSTKEDLKGILESVDERLEQEGVADLLDYVIKICMEEMD